MYEFNEAGDVEFFRGFPPYLAEIVTIRTVINKCEYRRNVLSLP